MSSTSSEPRMLERRISNQRAELSNDQQMNYLLAWFTNWSDLQKEDFVPILAEKLSSKWAAVNGVNETLSHLSLSQSERPPSLFQCQVGHGALRLTAQFFNYLFCSRGSSKTGLWPGPTTRKVILSSG